MTQFDTFDRRATQWAREAFGNTVVDNQRERAARFIEEAIELAQAVDLVEEEVVDIAYSVYCKPMGEVAQEIGGTMVTLGVLTRIMQLDLETCAEKELLRCHAKIQDIRERNKNKKSYLR